VELEGQAYQTGGMSPAGSSAAFDSFNEIATVRIELRDSDPVIWRQVEVPSSITLKVLHNVIQAAMGWFDYHLLEFTIAKRRYGLPMDEDWGTEPRTDASKVRLRDVLRPRRTTIDYLYDFGDCWEHRLTVTNIRGGDPDLSYPGTSPASATRRPKTAAASPASTRPSMPPPTPTTRTMPKPRNGSTITIPMCSTNCRSNTPSAASPTSVTPPRLGSPRKNHRQPPADQPDPPSPAAFGGAYASSHEGRSLLLCFYLDPGLASPALAEAIAVAVHLEDADVVCQPVEQRAGQTLGPEGLGPLVERQIAGDQRGATPKPRCITCAKSWVG
jgi:hypothetical protein